MGFCFVRYFVRHLVLRMVYGEIARTDYARLSPSSEFEAAKVRRPLLFSGGRFRESFGSLAIFAAIRAPRRATASSLLSAGRPSRMRGQMWRHTLRGFRQGQKPI